MRFPVSGAMLMAVVASAAAIPSAYAQSCQQLWVERNSYYKARGYCFKSARAISYFGNGGVLHQGRGPPAIVARRTSPHRPDRPSRAGLRLQLKASPGECLRGAVKRAAGGPPLSDRLDCVREMGFHSGGSCSALVAQLDRAPDFEFGGRGFDSPRANKTNSLCGIAGSEAIDQNCGGNAGGNHRTSLGLARHCTRADVGASSRLHTTIETLREMGRRRRVSRVIRSSAIRARALPRIALAQRASIAICAVHARW